MMKRAPTRRPQPSEEGYVLVAVICLVAMLTIALAVALPKVSKEIQRDRELETMHRGLQYARGVKLYYKKFGAYPPSVDALVKTNNIRFLRKKYTDPTTGKEDWKPVRFGQNKAPTAMGFFGVPLAGSTIAGTGPSGGNGLAGGSSLGGSNSFGGNNAAGASSFNQQTATPDPNAALAQGANSSNSSGGNTTGDASTAASTTATATGSTGSTTGTGTGLSGQTFGGAGIIGFSPNSPKQSIMVYKKKNHYNEWEFVYDPLAEQMMMQGGNTGSIGQPASSTTTPVGGSSNTGTTSTSTTSTTSTTP